MRPLQQVFLVLVYYIVSFGIVNISFPIRRYFAYFSYPRAYIVSSFLLLCLVITLLTAVPLGMMARGRTRWARVWLRTLIQFALVSGFAVACSGLGFGWSLSGSGPFSRLSFFFSEFEWLRFIFEAGLPLAAAAAFLYYLASPKGGVAGW